MSHYDSVLVVGAGTIGLSTAWHLVNRGYKVVCIDPYPPPSVLSAGHDLNKIVRTEYDSVLYTKIAHEAIELWRKPPFAPAFHETGWLTATTVTDPDKSTFKRAIENTIRYGDASRLERLDSREAIRQRVPLLSGDMAGWSAYWNGNAGWVDSSEAMRLLRDACAEAGVRFVHGSSGTLSELVRDGSGKVVGILAEDKSEFRADATILALGAWSDVHLDFEGQIASVGVMTAHVQLSEDERVKYADLPVIECEGMGYFFPPNSDGILKACDLSPGRTNFVSKKDRRQSVPFDPREPVPDTIKAQGEAAVRRLLQATLPELANTKFKEFRACWDSEALSKSWIISPHPSSPTTLFIATGGSRHSFKNLPNIGKYVVDMMEDKLNDEMKEEWKWRPEKVKGDEWAKREPWKSDPQNITVEKQSWSRCTIA